MQMQSTSDEMSRQRRARRHEVERNDRVLLDAARRVFIRDGRQSSVAAIAEAAGVGVGTLYRRYESKTALFERLLALTNQQWADAVARARAQDDPGVGLATLVVESVEFGQGALAELGQLISPPRSIERTMAQADKDLRALLASARASGALNPEITAEDVILLIEQLARSPLIEQISALDDPALLETAKTARRRLIAIALNGLGSTATLPGPPSDPGLLHARWRAPHA